MAATVGLSPGAIRCIWRAHGLQPLRVRPFPLSNDPKCVEQLRGVVGLDRDPPAHATVLSVEGSEPSSATGPAEQANRIQTLDRTQPGLPLKAVALLAAALLECPAVRGFRSADRASSRDAALGAGLRAVPRRPWPDGPRPAGRRQAELMGSWANAPLPGWRSR